MNESRDTKGKKDYKDTVFRMLFREKSRLLQLYNAMNGSDYTDSDALEIVTLENAVYMNMKNDLAFLADFHLYLYEHQSTVNPNMPLRFLQYVAREYEKLVCNENIYRKKRLVIPAPRFVVFYNGVDYLPERLERKLSDSYRTREADPRLELKVQVLNINQGNNEALKEQCGVLREYMQYVECVRRNAERAPTEQAVALAVEECISRGILAEFLRKNKAEVIPMSIFEYDEEATLKAIREDEFEFGMEKGIAQAIGLMLEACSELGNSKEATAAKVKEKFGLQDEELQKYMEEFWK